MNNKTKIYRVAVTGPESTGKSMLAKQLAEHYRTAWVPEYAREYIAGLKREYTQDDILEIAQTQLRNEEAKARKADRLLFCDTELIVTKIWSEVKYKSCHQWILDKIEAHIYDLYLLCNIDLPWEYDPQREHPEMREELFGMYLHELESRKFPFTIISGLNEDRLKNAITIVDKDFKSTILHLP
jgi:NadR type nicotinamide-nucleotide adenylyltransferase